MTVDAIKADLAAMSVLVQTHWTALSNFVGSLDWYLRSRYASGELVQVGDSVYVYVRHSGLFERRDAKEFWDRELSRVHWERYYNELRTPCALIMSQRFRNTNFFAAPSGITTAHGQYVWDKAENQYYLRNHSSVWRSRTFVPLDASEPMTNKKLIFRVRGALPYPESQPIVEMLHRIGRP